MYDCVKHHKCQSVMNWCYEILDDRICLYRLWRWRKRGHINIFPTFPSPVVKDILGSRDQISIYACKVLILFQSMSFVVPYRRRKQTFQFYSLWWSNKYNNNKIKTDNQSWKETLRKRDSKCHDHRSVPTHIVSRGMADKQKHNMNIEDLTFVLMYYWMFLTSWGKYKMRGFAEHLIDFPQRV